MEEIRKEMEEENITLRLDNLSDLEKFDSADESVKEKKILICKHCKLNSLILKETGRIVF
nr:CMF_HP1_G0006630.mRNA.1.CDS.1 [Saccharomyces cerevisiae]